LQIELAEEMLQSLHSQKSVPRRLLSTRVHLGQWTQYRQINLSIC